jgi:hypothetical protein
VWFSDEHSCGLTRGIERLINRGMDLLYSQHCTDLAASRIHL